MDTIIDHIAPHQCAGCGAEGRIVCDACVGGLTVLPPRCYRCQKASPDFLTCTACRMASRLQGVTAAVTYEGLAKQLVWSLKFEGAQAAARIMAAQMTLAPGLSDDNRSLLIVPVPTATGRTRQRGYDQAKLLAREFARKTRLPYCDCLARHGQTHQLGATRRQRLGQLETAFRVKRAARISGATLLLIDDVMTTGATLESAATVLAAAGAKQIKALVFAAV